MKQGNIYVRMSTLKCKFIIHVRNRTVKFIFHTVNDDDNKNDVRNISWNSQFQIEFGFIYTYN